MAQHKVRANANNTRRLPPLPPGGDVEKLFEVLAQMWEELVPLQVLEPDERGIRIRTIPFIGPVGAWLKRLWWPLGPFFQWALRWLPDNGQWVTEVYPGAVMSIPFIDDIQALVVVARVIDLDNVRVETRDHKVYIVSITVAYKIGNVKRAILETEEFESSFGMDVQAIAARWVNSHYAEQVSIPALCEEVEEDVAKAAIKWGCRLDDVGVNSLAQHKVLSLLHSHD